MKQILIAGLICLSLLPVSATAVDYRLQQGVQQGIGVGSSFLLRKIIQKIGRRGKKNPPAPMDTKPVPVNNGVSDIVGQAPQIGATIAQGGCQGLTDCVRLPSTNLIFVRDRLVERYWSFVTAGNPAEYVFDTLVAERSGRQDGEYSNYGFGGYGEARSDVSSRGQYHVSFVIRRVSDGALMSQEAEVVVSYTTDRQGYTTFWINGYNNQKFTYENVSNPFGEAVRLGLETMLRRPDQQPTRQ